MALKVKCKCGTILKVPSAMADKKVTCPGCEKFFVIPASRFSTTPKQVKPAPAAAPPVPNVIPASLDDELSSLSLVEQTASSTDVLYGLAGESASSNPRIEAPLPAVQIERVSAASTLQYAGDPRKPGPGKLVSSAIEGPRRSFWMDLLYAFVFPCGTAGNAIGTIVLVAVNVATQFFCFGALIGIYMASVYMNVVSDTASGSDDLKAAPLEGGIYDGLIKPFLNFLASFLFAMAPGIICTILMLMKILPQNTVLLLIWMVFGAFLWPMFMLMASLSAWSLLSKPQLVCMTIAQTILPYLAIWAALFVAFMLNFTSTVGQQLLVQLGVKSGNLFTATFGVVGGIIASQFTSLYFTLVSMRLIGLYYLHNKRKFAFMLE